MLEQRIQQHFYESADLIVQAAEALSRPVAGAAQALVTSLTAGAKMLVVGLGASQGTAQRLAGAFIGRFERDRPGLAALVLRPDADSGGHADVLQQLQALGQPGDVLVLVGARGDDPRLDTLAREARQKDMTTVALVGHAADALAATLTDTDVLIRVPHEREARVHELHLMIVHCLCDAVDLQLMGEEPLG